MNQHAVKKKKSRVWPWAAGIGLFLANKLKWVLGLLKIGKFATLVSMMVSLGAYAVFYGWKFAVAIVYLIFVHEMGHLWAAKRKKLKTSSAIFIPFLGAAIGLKEMPKNAKDEAYIAYAGPLFGMLAFLPAVVLYEVNGSPFWGLVIFLGAMLNLFNLFPVSPLDGGRIAGVLSTKIWAIGLAAIIPLLFFSPDPIIFLIFLFGIGTWWKRVREDFDKKKRELEITLMEKEIENVRKIELELEVYRDMPNFSYILNTYLDDISVALSRLNNSVPEGIMLPFIHDKKKLERRTILTTIGLLTERRYKFIMPYKQFVEHQAEKAETLDLSAETLIFAEDLEPRFAENHITALKQNIQELQIELDKMKNYYQSSLKTKIIVLVLYLLLAAALSYFVVYGNSIMELHRNMLPR